MEGIQRSVASRKAYRSHVTCLFHKMEELITKSSHLTLEESELTTLNNCLEQLKHKRKILAELDTKISETITNPDGLETEIFQAEELQDSILEHASQAKRLVENPQPVIVQQPLNVDAISYQPLQANDLNSQVNGTDTVVHEEQPPGDAVISASDNNSDASDAEGRNGNTYLSLRNTATPTQITTRLPKLTLPTFAGDPLSWRTFWDSFEAAVHSNHTLSRVQKFNYLRAQVKDEAAKTIAGFPLTNENYEHSVILLKERFGHTYKIVKCTHAGITSFIKPFQQYGKSSFIL